jgi:DNA replication and repair protein RecF
MVLKQIELLNFRLHRNTSLNFSDRLNLFIGGNGQGKTTVLEAIYYLSTTKNLNLASEVDVVTFGQDNFDIKGKFIETTENYSRLLYDIQKNKKTFFLNEKQIFKSSEVIGRFPIVALLQSDHAITLGAPVERRRFTDSVISQASHTYLDILLEYNRTLKQRANLLAKIKENNGSNLFDQLEAWTEALIVAGAELTRQRINFVGEFNGYLKESYKRIIDFAEEPAIEYETVQEINLENIEQCFRNELVARREEELRRGANLVGPHRDDFLFSIGGLPLRRFGSQGQHKTFQIALRFAQFFYMKEKLARTPIFLMDDVFGELDAYRAGKISAYLSEIGQAFITMTDFGKMEELNLSKESTVIKIEKGSAEYVN